MNSSKATSPAPAISRSPKSRPPSHSLDPETEIVAYCRGPWCVLSFDAIELLRARGFKARRLAEGYPEWKAAGLPIGQSEMASTP